MRPLTARARARRNRIREESAPGRLRVELRKLRKELDAIDKELGEIEHWLWQVDREPVKRPARRATKVTRMRALRRDRKHVLIWISTALARIDELSSHDDTSG